MKGRSGACDAHFIRRDFFQRVSQSVHVIERDVRHDRNERIGGVGCVPFSAKPTSRTAASTFCRAKCQSPRNVTTSNSVGCPSLAGDAFDVRQSVDEKFVEFGVRNSAFKQAFAGQNADAFVPVVKVRRCIKSDFAIVLREQARGKFAGRTFAVGAADETCG
jgi:hypothetical protein